MIEAHLDLPRPERAFHRSSPHSGKLLSDKVFLLFLLTGTDGLFLRKMSVSRSPCSSPCFQFPRSHCLLRPFSLRLLKRNIISDVRIGDKREVAEDLKQVFRTGDRNYTGSLFMNRKDTPAEL